MNRMIQIQDLQSPQNAPWTPRSAAMTMGSFSVRSAVVRTSARWDKSACVTRKSLPGFAGSFSADYQEKVSRCGWICWILKRVLLVAIGDICEICGNHFCSVEVSVVEWNYSTERILTSKFSRSFRPTAPLRYIIQQELPGIVQHFWALIRPSEISLLCIVILIISWYLARGFLLIFFSTSKLTQTVALTWEDWSSKCTSCKIPNRNAKGNKQIYLHEGMDGSMDTEKQDSRTVRDQHRSVAWIPCMSWIIMNQAHWWHHHLEVRTHAWPLLRKKHEKERVRPLRL